jgi:plastocyanin
MPHRRPLTAAATALALAAPAAPAGAKSLTIEASEFAFAPSRVTAQAGQTVTLTFENTGRLSHNLKIKGLEAATETLQAGNSQTLRVTPQDPGRYEIRCTVPGHAEAGMTGTLVVTD